MQDKKLFPVFDMAYQGFASGDCDFDALPLRSFVDAGECPRMYTAPGLKAHNGCVLLSLCAYGFDAVPTNCVCVLGHISEILSKRYT